MSGYKLPRELRSGAYTRPLKIGLDVPGWFIDDLRAIDSNLYLVWHPYKVLYDDVMTQYEGLSEDPRFTISPQPQYGCDEIWGFVLTDGQERPLPDNRWHVWRLSRDRGWSHIVQLEDVSSSYLTFFLERLSLQSRIQDKYGTRAWSRFQWEEEMLRQERAELDEHEDFRSSLEENRSLMREVLDNWRSGYTAPTNPQKDVIMSYSGQRNRSKISRPITDEEGGLVVPARWSR